MMLIYIERRGDARCSTIAMHFTRLHKKLPLVVNGCPIVPGVVCDGARNHRQHARSIISQTSAPHLPCLISHHAASHHEEHASIENTSSASRLVRHGTIVDRVCGACMLSLKPTAGDL